MKKYLLCMIMLPSMFALYAQKQDHLSAIKLYLNPTAISLENKTLDTILQDRLFRKTTQLINQTGVAEIGYSNFLVIPKFDILSNNMSRTGITSIYMAECEFAIDVKRAAFGSFGSATFNSFSKSIIGSGSTKQEAIADAINSISSRDNDVVGFFNQTKEKINTYFQTHCSEVIKEAQQALDLKEYAKSIALFFSVPTNAPCYKTALERSKGAYVTYVEDECNRKLIQLKSYVAMALSQNDSVKNHYYNDAIEIVNNLNPASDKCFAEVKIQIDKIENRLSAEQKESWEMKKKKLVTDADIEKEQYKAMAKINSTYQQPAASTNVIIAK